MTQRAERQIVPMTEETVHAAAEMLKACFSAPWSESIYRRDLADPQSLALLCTENGAVIGFIHCSYVLDELTLNTLAVLPDYRRQGIARMLWAEMRRRMQDICTVCYLEVRESNAAARTLYQSLGFVQNGLRPRYYSDPEEAAVLMENRNLAH